MFIGGGVGGIWNDEQEAAWFYQGYGQAEIDLLALSYYRYERIVVDIAEYAAQIFGMQGSVEEREKGLGLRNQFSPNNVVEIAHRSYQGPREGTAAPALHSMRTPRSDGRGGGAVPVPTTARARARCAPAAPPARTRRALRRRDRAGRAGHRARSAAGDSSPTTALRSADPLAPTPPPGRTPWRGPPHGSARRSARAPAAPAHRRARRCASQSVASGVRARAWQAAMAACSA